MIDRGRPVWSPTSRGSSEPTISGNTRPPLDGWRRVWMDISPPGMDAFLVELQLSQELSCLLASGDPARRKETVQARVRIAGSHAQVVTRDLTAGLVMGEDAAVRDGMVLVFGGHEEQHPLAIVPFVRGVQ